MTTDFVKVNTSPTLSYRTISNPAVVASVVDQGGDGSGPFGIRVDGSVIAEYAIVEDANEALTALVESLGNVHELPSDA